MTAKPVPEHIGDEIDALAQEIRRVDGENRLGAGALAEALQPFLTELQHRREAEAGVTAPDIDMARHWIDRYAAGIDEEPQMSRILDALGVSALGEHP